MDILAAYMLNKLKVAYVEKRYLLNTAATQRADCPGLVGTFGNLGGYVEHGARHDRSIAQDFIHSTLQPPKPLSEQLSKAFFLF